ncbi:dUTP diphosphatase [Corynebacterium bovis]|uniref:dUTP diphosphatase n=1 Tax=Corynebacterium bovis TaxID=36808 RepID=UPI0024496A3C|nr:dUTP diphosphatase [Corynebacterium bovis]MDH2455087.1 dUTP diphosphatase [Corynebacterium bovis]
MNDPSPSDTVTAPATTATPPAPTTGAGRGPGLDGGGEPLRVHRLDPDLPLPRRAHPGDAGLDLYSSEDLTLQPGQRELVGTGVAVALPTGTVGLVHPRSGRAWRDGLSIVNAPGTVDAGYRGEIKVCLINLDRVTPVTIARGDRIAQFVVQDVRLCEVEEVADAADLGESERGDGGHGSSGV